jgi:hypothetical protein
MLYEVYEFDPRKEVGAFYVRTFNTIDEARKYTTDPNCLYRLIHRGEAVTSITLIGKPIYGVWYEDNIDCQKRALRWWSAWDSDRSIREGLVTEEELFSQCEKVAKLEMEHLQNQNALFKDIEKLNRQAGVRMDIYQTIPNVEDFIKLYVYPTDVLFELWNLGDADWDDKIGRLIRSQTQFASQLKEIARHYKISNPGKLNDKEFMEWSKLVLPNGLDIVQLAYISLKVPAGEYNEDSFMMEAQKMEDNINNFLLRAIRRGDTETFARMVPIIIEAYYNCEFPIPIEFAQLNKSFADAAAIFKVSRLEWKNAEWTAEMFEPLMQLALLPAAPEPTAEATASSIEILEDIKVSPDTPEAGEKISMLVKRKREYEEAEKLSILAKDLLDAAIQDLDNEMPPNKRGKVE